jgi:phage-related protein
MLWSYRSGETPIMWLDTALEACLEFPSLIRKRFGCELATVRRWGLGRAWEPLRGAPGLASLALRSGGRTSLPTFYRIVSTTTLPDAFVVVHSVVRKAARGASRVLPRDIGFARARLLDVGLDRQERRSVEAGRVRQLAAEPNLFIQLGFPAQEAEDLMLRAELIVELRHALRRRADNGHADSATRAIVDGDIDALSVELLSDMAERMGIANPKQGS